MSRRSEGNAKKVRCFRCSDELYEFAKGYASDEEVSVSELIQVLLESVRIEKGVDARADGEPE